MNANPILLRRWNYLAAALLFLVVALAVWRENHRVQPIPVTPTLTGQVEYCLSCHSDLAEISPSHPIQTFGCVSCHGGERLALNADLAHSTMRGGKNPSDFAVVQASCGGDDCHSGSAETNKNHIQRATTSIQSTYAGAIAMIRFTFGAQSDLQPLFGTSAILDPESTSGLTTLAAFDPSDETNPFVQTFGRDCLTCHLLALPSETGTRYDHFTGCSACHTPTQSPDLTSANTGTDVNIHKLTTAISYTQCDTCHNRGNYDLRGMTFQARTDQPADRLQDYYQPIAQFTRCEWTLDCIDCHTRMEAMGDGSLYGNKKQIQYIQCRTCHGTLTELPKVYTVSDPNDIALRQSLLNPVVDLKLGDFILVTDKGEPLWNTRVMENGDYLLVGKATGEIFTFKPVMGSGCQQDLNDQSSNSCHKCHSVQR